MKISREEIRQQVIKSLYEILNKQETTEINDQMDPIRDLGLDSPDGVEFACLISEKIDFHIPDKVNPFVDDNRRRPRRVGQIVDLIYGMLHAGQETKNG